MKLKFPKKIRIDETVWTIKYPKDTNAGTFDWGKCELSIGIKDYPAQPTLVLHVIIHELKEIIHVQQATRFDRPDVDSEYIFVYNHANHTDLCYRLAGLLDNFIK